MTNKFFRYILLAATLIFIWQACDSEDPSKNASFLRLKLTDATSFTIKEMYVDIREISVFLVDTTQEGEWMPLNFSGREYNILELINGRTTILLEQFVPAGTKLHQIKLMLGHNNRFVTNKDSTVTLQIPTEFLEGIVIDAMDMEMLANTISSVIIDINASLSIRESNGNYFLHPEARAFPEIFGGKLKGFVSPLSANPYVVVVQDKDTFITKPEREAPGDPVGSFQFIGLKEGEWEVHMLPDPESEYLDTTFISTIETGKTFEITPKPIRLKLRPGAEE